MTWNCKVCPICLICLFMQSCIHVSMDFCLFVNFWIINQYYIIYYFHKFIYNWSLGACYIVWQLSTFKYSTFFSFWAIFNFPPAILRYSWQISIVYILCVQHNKLSHFLISNMTRCSRTGVAHFLSRGP